MRICLVSPYALTGSHPVADHVRGVATELARRDHQVTVLAPSASTRALRSGRRRLRALAEGDGEALIALPGEPLPVAVGPAVPAVARGRRRGAGIPIASAANVASAVIDGGFDVVHAYDPLAPGLSPAAVKHSRSLTVATFHATTERALPAPMLAPARERLRSRVDALVATSDEARALAVQTYPGDYTIVPLGVDARFLPAAKVAGTVVAEWSPDARHTVRALIRLAARTPEMSLVLLWAGRTRRPLRPTVPAGALGRVHTASPRDTDARAAVLAPAAVFVAAPDGDAALAWEAAAAGCVPIVPAGFADAELAALALTYATDQPPLVAAATARALADARLREELAGDAAAAAGARRHEAVAATLEELYTALRGRRRGGRRSPATQPPPREAVRADFHMHTSASFDCATEPADLLDRCIAEGFGAVAITDHNEVDGALEAASLGKPITVVVGEEVKSSQGEVIGLFLHERIPPGMSFADTVAAIQEQGGVVYVPHPFDRLHTIPDPATLLRHLDDIDVMEVYNSRLMLESFNDDALRFATKYNLLGAAGSDAHVVQGIGTAINRLPAFDGPEEFLLAMRHNRIERRPRSLLYLQGLKWVQQVGGRG